MTSKRLTILLLGLSLASWGCAGSSDGSGGSAGSGAGGGGGTGNSSGGGDSDSNPAKFNTVKWQFEQIEVGGAAQAAGIQGRLLRAADGTLHYGYLRFDTDGPAACDIAVFAGGAIEASEYQFKTARRAPGASAWTIELQDLSSVGAATAFVNIRYGIGGVMDGTEPVFTFAGGGSGLFTCGSSDLVVARCPAAGGACGLTAPATASGDCCTPAATECPDPACTSGTDVGAWSAAAVDASGNLAVAFVDHHNTTDQDGGRWMGYEFFLEGSGISGIRPWDGAGAFGDLIFHNGTFVSAFASFVGGGIRTFRRTASAGSIMDWEPSQKIIDSAAVRDDWASDLAANGKIGERISMQIAPDDRIGLAYHELSNGSSDTNVLYYCESFDGALSWSCEQPASILTGSGAYPSLAFDSGNRPVIAYRACGVDGSCENNVDGARLAWRELNGTWNLKDIHFDNSTKSGLYNQLVLDPVTDEPTVVFHDQTAGSALVAQGSF